MGYRKPFCGSLKNKNLKYTGWLKPNCKVLRIENNHQKYKALQTNEKELITHRASKKTNQMKKSEIMKKAWNTFRQFNITFSEALKDSWKSFKFQEMINRHRKIFSRDKKRIALAIKERTQFEQDNIRTSVWNFRNIVNNDGAAAYYNLGMYSGD